MSNLRMSVYTLMGLISTDIPLATVTDKRSGRVFEIAAIKLNFPAVTLVGGLERDTKLPKTLLSILRPPQNRAKEWVHDWSDEFRINAEFFAIRERKKDGTIGQSWAFRTGTLTKGQRGNLIQASSIVNIYHGPIIPRFVMEVGAGRNQEQALERRLAMRPAGLYFTSKPAKGKRKGAKASNG